MAQEISHSMVREMRTEPAPHNPATAPIFDLLLHYLTCDVARQLVETNSSSSPFDDSLYARLQRIETKLEQLSLDSNAGAKEEQEEEREEREQQIEEDENEDAETGTSTGDLPNQQSKYAKIDSMLKYIENDEDAKGIKLVIMNFND